jgi:APA family basic amino acid/polyamine antiporter
VSLVVGFSAPIAAAALLFASYLAAFVPGLGGAVATRSVACLLIVAMSLLHAFDTRVGSRVQTGFAIAKVLLIVVFIVAGLVVGTGDWSHFASRGDGLLALGTGSGAASYATALMYVGFAYSGWNAATYIAGEIRAPQRTLPRALLLGTVVVMLLYMGLNLVFLYAIPPESMAVDPIHRPVGDLAARALFGPYAGGLLSSLIALALVSAVSAMIMAGPRVYAAMAADHALPKGLAYHSRRGVPLVAVVVQCMLAIGFAVAGDPDQLIRIAGFTLAIFAALAVGAVFVFRARGKVSAYRIPGYPVTPLLFIGLSLWTVAVGISANPGVSLAIIAVLVVGAGVTWRQLEASRTRDAAPAVGPSIGPTAASG